MTWIQTFTGKQFFPLAPRGEDVDIVDIAHALSNMCRFNGHCREFYSVAEHSVRVCRAAQGVVFDGATLKAALMHDAAEAYLPDIPRPIKMFLHVSHHADSNMSAFKLHEDALTACIFGALDIGVGEDIDWNIIKHYDDVLLATEARDIMAPAPKPWHPLPAPLPRLIVPWSQNEAKHAFLETWDQLRRLKA